MTNNEYYNDEQAKLSDLSQRANILHKTIDDKSLLLYEDHRYLLNILYFARFNKTIKGPVNLLRFDYHDDCRPNDIPLDRLQYFRNFDKPLSEFWSFTEFELSFLDDNWMTVGFDLGLISDVVLIGSESSGNIPGNGILFDKFGNEHKINKVLHIWNGLEYQGWLSDIHRSEEFRPLWNILGWGNHQGRFSFNSALCPAPLVLDIDLDCFTLEYEGITEPIPEHIFYNLMKRRPRHDLLAIWNTEQFLTQIIKHCEFITICMESNHCGGIRNAIRILQLLDDRIFDNNIMD